MRTSRGLAAAAGAAAVAGLAFVTPRTAEAQVHWDGAAQAGPIKRWLSERDAGAPDAGFGGQLQASAHVALLPLVRVGAYGTFDATPAGEALRLVYGGGVRTKLFVPLPRSDQRVWFFAGLGLLGVASPSYRGAVPARTTAGLTTTVDGDVASASGRLFEVPLGLGASWKVWGPWAITAELGVRFGFAHAGEVYDGRPWSVSGASSSGLDPAAPLPRFGVDRWAAGLTVGVLYDR